MFLEIAQKAFEVLGYLPKDLWQVMSDLSKLRIGRYGRPVVVIHKLCDCLSLGRRKHTERVAFLVGVKARQVNEATSEILQSF